MALTLGINSCSPSRKVAIHQFNLFKTEITVLQTQNKLLTDDGKTIAVWAEVAIGVAERGNDSDWRKDLRESWIYSNINPRNFSIRALVEYDRNLSHWRPVIDDLLDIHEDWW